MNKYFYLMGCLTFALVGMEQEYLQDYRKLVILKNRIFDLAAHVKRDHKGSCVVLQPSRENSYDYQQQTKQGFALVWEIDRPKGVLWRLGLWEIVASSSSVSKGDELFLEKIIQEFQAEEIGRKPRLLRTNSGQETPIGNQQIITYALNRLNNSALSPVAMKNASELIDKNTAQGIYEALESL